ncbi:hypothetical protein D3C76_802430 [compost metagenome]
MPADHHCLAAIELPAALYDFRTGLYVVQLVMALRLVEGDRQLQLPAGHLRQQVVLLRVVAQLRDQAAGEDHRMQVRLQAQATAELGHDHLGVHAGAAQAAEFLGEGHCGQAEFAQLCPHLVAEAAFALQELLALFEAVAVAHQAGGGVLQHLLLFGQFEVHALAPLTARESFSR